MIVHSKGNESLSMSKVINGVDWKSLELICENLNICDVLCKTFEGEYNINVRVIPNQNGNIIILNYTLTNDEGTKKITTIKKTPDTIILKKYVYKDKIYSVNVEKRVGKKTISYTIIKRIS